jgi:hypothetical protein
LSARRGGVSVARVLKSLTIPAAAVAAVLLGASLAGAQTQIAPFPLSPANGKSLPRGVPFTFKVRTDPESDPAGVFLKVSKSKAVGSDGTLAHAVYFRALTQSGSLWVKRVERYKALSSHFLNRSGRYYWQPYVVDCSDGTDDCNVEGDIHSFRIK